MKECKCTRTLQDRDYRKRWHITRDRGGFMVLRFGAVAGMVLVSPLPKTCRFTRGERADLIRGAAETARESFIPEGAGHA